jgi:hypothetical protein
MENADQLMTFKEDGEAAFGGLACDNPKHGRVCVDVESNIKDPLGAMERAKRPGGNTKTEKTSVNTQVATRKPSGKKATPGLKSYIPVRK